MASSSDLERAAKKGKRRAENDLVELTKKGERIEALMKECEEEVVRNNCDAVPCPCSSCLGCYMRLIPEIERHLYRYGPGPSEKVTVGKMLMWKCFDAGMKDFQEYEDSQKDRTDSILVPHSIEKTRIHGFDPSMNGLWSNDLPIFIDHPFEYYGRKYIVQKSKVHDNAGNGLFILETVEKDEELFPYNGPRYKFKVWKSLCSYYPRMKEYGLVENEAPGVSEKDARVIVGDVLNGNVAGYINSSIHNPSLTNARWEFSPSLKPWTSLDSTNPSDFGYIATITTRKIKAGSELLIEYQFGI